MVRKKFCSQIFTTKDTDINKWRFLVDRSPQADIFFMPEYAMLFEKTEGEVREAFGGEAVLFFYGDEDNYIIYPFFKRKISELPFHKFLLPESKDWFDITSPYGYSGPLCYITQSSLENRLWKEFFEEFHCYCVESKIVSEFVRFNPYIKNHIFIERFREDNIKISGKLVYIDLTQDKSIIKKGATKGNRSSLSKAIRSAIEIFHSKNKKEIDIFCYLYLNTMKRKQIDKAYLFSNDFFNSTFSLLDKNAELFLARYKNRIIAASLFLFKGDFFHYYLSGSDAEFLSLCPNNLLLYEAIAWAKEQGFKVFNLGGGNKLNDSLFCFKSSFSKTRTDFYTYSRVHNAHIYRLLCEASNKSRVPCDKNKIESDYFPEYRIRSRR